MTTLTETALKEKGCMVSSLLFVGMFSLYSMLKQLIESIENIGTVLNNTTINSRDKTKAQIYRDAKSITIVYLLQCFCFCLCTPGLPSIGRHVSFVVTLRAFVLG